MTLFSEQSIAAVPGAERPDLARLREVAYIFILRVATPGRARLIGAERSAHRVQPAHKLSLSSESIQHMASYAGHNVHARDHVGRVRDLHPNLRNGRADRTHAVRHHEHGAADHGGGE